MARIRVSLANKCQILFGAAVLLILAAALAVPWLRMQELVQDGQRAIARGLSDAWLNQLLPTQGLFSTTTELGADQDQAIQRVRLITSDDIELESQSDPMLQQAMDLLFQSPDTEDVLLTRRGERLLKSYYYLRAIRQSDFDKARGSFDPSLGAMQPFNPLRAVLVIEMRADWAKSQLLLNRVYVIGAGVLAGVLAIAVFWFITTRIILSPVRVLRDTAEKVAEGDLNIRTDIATGDEFEQLSDAFNLMLANLKKSQDQLRALNKQLDLKLGELAETNVSLFQANQLKTDFLANVSHELRTPLNSIIGFAEVMADNLVSASDPSTEKHQRYLDNILKSSKALLTLITELLDLAKIEAGRVDLHIETMSISDTCESLLGLIRPQADNKALILALNLQRELPVIETDPGKFQQIIFNFLSNAVKFTPQQGRIELGAEPIHIDGEVREICVWVLDTGPGIPHEEQEAVFEKFHQIDSSHTKQHGGTGLGLAISQELAKLLKGRIELDSDTNKGAKFSLFVPIKLEETEKPLMPDS